jgi:hypothetical protein
MTIGNSEWVTYHVSRIKIVQVRKISLYALSLMSHHVQMHMILLEASLPMILLLRIGIRSLDNVITDQAFWRAPTKATSPFDRKPNSRFLFLTVYKPSFLYRLYSNLSVQKLTQLRKMN